MKTKNILYTFLIILFFLLSCQNKKKDNSTDPQQSSCQDNLDGSITIQGRITLKGTKEVPLGVTTMNIKNKWVFTKDLTKPLATKKKIALGENLRVFVNKDGYYRITIDKNDTLALIPMPYLYKRPKFIVGLTKSQTLNIELEALHLEVVQNFEKESALGYKAFYKQLINVSPDTLITISGIIHKVNSSIPLENVPITTSFVSNTNGTSTFHLSDEYGQFIIQTPKNSHIVINGMASNYVDFLAKRDTVLNLKI